MAVCYKGRKFSGCLPSLSGSLILNIQFRISYLWWEHSVCVRNMTQIHERSKTKIMNIQINRSFILNCINMHSILQSIGKTHFHCSLEHQYFLFQLWFYYLLWIVVKDDRKAYNYILLSTKILFWNRLQLNFRW